MVDYIYKNLKIFEKSSRTAS